MTDRDERNAKRLQGDKTARMLRHLTDMTDLQQQREVAIARHRGADPDQALEAQNWNAIFLGVQGLLLAYERGLTGELGVPAAIKEIIATMRTAYTKGSGA